MQKLSIITINYNNKEGLLKTIESIVSQVYKDFEYIIIDGGSTDGSLEIIEQFRDHIDVVVSEPDSGVYHAMNKGIRVAKGKYVNFMNSGDFFYEETTLEKVSNHFDKDISLLYGDSVYFNEKGEKDELPDKKLSFKFFLNSGINHQATFIKRSLFSKYFYYNEEYKICSDWEFFIYIICKENESYLHVNEIICYYDFSGISADPKNLDLFHKEREDTIDKFFPLFREDYKVIEELRIKRIRQVIHIKKYPIAWRFFKWIISFFLLFLPKMKRR